VKQNIKIIRKVDFAESMILKSKNFEFSKESRLSTNPENENKHKICRLTDSDEIIVVKTTSCSISESTIAD
jgi:hypothetical protein